MEEDFEINSNDDFFSEDSLVYKNEEIHILENKMDIEEASNEQFLQNNFIENYLESVVIGQSKHLGSDEDKSDLEDKADNEDEEDILNNWEKIELNKIIPSKTINFSERIGFNYDNDIKASDNNALFFFKLYFTDILLNEIVTHTNNYYKFKETIEIKKFEKRRHEKKWKEIDLEELHKYIGVMIIMGIIRLPSVTDYWKVNEFYKVPSVHGNFSRDRFWQIGRYLHITDYSFTYKNHKEKFLSIIKFSDHILESCKKYYVPHQKISLDETMIQFKGKSKFIQYMPNKPIKFGYKVFSVCDSESYYLYNFKFYLGKESQEKTVHNFSTEISLNMLDCLAHKGYIVYMDSFYSSFELFKILIEKGFGAVGTVKANRKSLPHKKIIEKKNCYRNEFFFRNNILLTKFIDKKVVLVLSTIHGNNTEKVSRFSKKGKKQVLIPSAVQDFNIHMRGVDIFNKMKTFYYYDHSFWKWWKTIFVFLLEVSIINSYILFKEYNKSKISQKDYRLSLAKQLIDYSLKNKQINYFFPKKKMKRSNCRLVSTKVHRDCKICSNRKIKRVTTRFMCEFCKVHICAAYCYDEHRLSNK